MLIIKEPNITPLPIMPDKDFDKDFLPRPLIKKPINGRKGINQTICKLFISPIPYPLKGDFLSTH